LPKSTGQRLHLPLSTEFWVQYTKMDKVNEIKSLLAEQIGVEAEDIKETDSFSEDLHMGPAEMADFSETLKKLEVDMAKIDFTNIETVGELLETLELHE